MNIAYQAVAAGVSESTGVGGAAQRPNQKQGGMKYVRAPAFPPSAWIADRAFIQWEGNIAYHVQLAVEIPA